MKFLIPFSLLVGVGSHLPWRSAPVVAAAPSGLSYVIDQVSGSFVDVPPPAAVQSRSLPLWFGGTIWAAGFAVVILSWWRRWWSLRSALRAASPSRWRFDMPVLTSASFPEPGVYGITDFLLLPAGIIDQLTPEQLEAIVAHELCHVRRRDNLATTFTWQSRPFSGFIRWRGGSAHG